MDELNIKEQCWISVYDSYTNGYNNTKGGYNGEHLGKTIIQLDLQSHFIKEWETINIAERDLDIYGISDVCRNDGNSAGGFLWQFKQDYDNGIKKMYDVNYEYCKKSIVQLDLKGNYIKEWSSARDIERELGFSYKGISLCCLDKIKKAYNFMWKFLDEYDETQITEYIDGTLKSVILLDLKGNYMKTFESAISASKELKISPSAITHCCKDNNGKASDFMFMYKSDWDNGKRREVYIPQEKAIVQLDLKGNFIKDWNCIMDASRELNLYDTNIVKCLKNKRRMTGNFMWLYKEDWNKGIKKTKYVPLKLAVVQLNKDGSFIKGFKSIADASRYILVSEQSIAYSIKNDSFCKKCLWQFKKDYDNGIIKVNINKKKRPILQLDLNENIIKQWDSISVVAKILKINHGNIGLCCQNRRNTAGGFKWRYNDDKIVNYGKVEIIL